MFSMCGCPPLSISPSLQSQETVGVISSACNFSSQQVSAKCGRQQPQYPAALLQLERRNSDVNDQASGWQKVFLGQF